MENDSKYSVFVTSREILVELVEDGSVNGLIKFLEVLEYVFPFSFINVLDGNVHMRTSPRRFWAML